MSYDFYKPQPAPSITQGIAGGISTAIDAIRKKRADAQAQSNLDRDYNLRQKQETFNEGEAQRRDVENGWSPATGTNAGGVPPINSQGTTPGDPDWFGGGDDDPGFSGFARTPSTDSTDGMTSPASSIPPATGNPQSLSAGIAAVRQQRTAAPTPGSPDWMGGGDTSDDDDPMAEHQQPPATTSGTEPPRTGSPTAGQVHFGGMLFDPMRTPASRAALLGDRLQQERELRERSFAQADRDRKVGEYNAAQGGNRGPAIADDVMKYDDATDNPQHFANVQHGEDISVAGRLAEIREENKGRLAEHAATHADQTDASTDRYLDDADVQVAQAQKGLEDARKGMLAGDKDSDHPEVMAAQHRLDAALDAQSRLAPVRQARIKKLTGVDTSTPTKKQPSADQVARMQRDPNYRQFLSEQGYDTSAKGTGGAFMSPFKIGTP